MDDIDLESTYSVRPMGFCGIKFYATSSILLTY
jgi:hypothetical protein